MSDLWIKNVDIRLPTKWNERAIFVLREDIKIGKDVLKKNFCSDLASVPFPFNIALPALHRYSLYALLHDDYCDRALKEKDFSLRRRGDYLFYKLMKKDRKIVYIRARIIYTGVTIKAYYNFLLGRYLK